VVYGAAGIPDFQALRRELGKKGSGRLRYHAFDLLHLDGYDLRNVPFMDRKQLLKQVLADTPEPLVYVEYLEAEGDRVLQHACKIGLEGVVAKRRNSIYRSGRTDDWIKLKCAKGLLPSISVGIKRESWSMPARRAPAIAKPQHATCGSDLIP
jgi:bifunctional non-homologous end joining protein LigD